MPVETGMKALRVLRAIAYLRLKGVRHGPMPYIRGKLPRVDARGAVRVGRRFKVEGLQHSVNFGAGPGGTLEIGDDVFLNRGATVFAVQSVTIGDGTKIADLAAVNDSNYHEVEEGKPVHVAPIRIGTNVWIGRGAIVLPGVTIGDHAVVGAGSVVSHDVPPRCLVAGVPASVLRKLHATDGWRRR